MRFFKFGGAGTIALYATLLAVIVAFESVKRESKLLHVVRQFIMSEISREHAFMNQYGRFPGLGDLLRPGRRRTTVMHPLIERAQQAGHNYPARSDDVWRGLEHWFPLQI